VADEEGIDRAVFFENVIRLDPNDTESRMEGRGRFHTELWVLNAVGLDVAKLSPSGRNAARYFFDGLFPFAVLILVSLFTKRPDQHHIDQFFGKMKTPVGATPELELQTMEETRRNPRRFDDKKLLGAGSNWEFTKWDKVDTVGFLICICVSLSILGLFWGLLQWAAS